MRRWIPMLCLVAACQLDAAPPSTTGATSPEGSVGQALSCTTAPTTCAVDMPKLEAWSGKLPATASNEFFMMFPNWDGKAGDMVLVLADYGDQTIPWGAMIDAGDVETATRQLEDQPLGNLIVPQGPLPPLPPIGGREVGAWVMNVVLQAANFPK